MGEGLGVRARKEQMEILQKIYDIIKDRDKNPQEGSYTNYLLKEGVDKTCKKVNEEAAEIIIGAKNKDKENFTAEVADLLYHLLVLMYQMGVDPTDIAKELEGRYQK